MSTIEDKLMTVDEFLALPDAENFDRHLINGELLEQPMTLRNRTHCRITARISFLIQAWMQIHPELGGECLNGEAGFKLGDASLVGIDVAYISAEQAAGAPEDVRFLEGAPVLAVEVLSPSDRNTEVSKKIASYLKANTPHVWIVNPELQQITVYAPGAIPQTYLPEHEITCESEMPGFTVKVSDVLCL